MLYYLTLVAVNAVESVEVSAFFFLACNLLWPCFLIETSDRFKWDSQIAKGLKLVTEVESSSREDGETRRDTSLLCYLVNNQPHSSIAVCRSPFHTKSDLDSHSPTRPLAQSRREVAAFYSLQPRQIQYVSAVKWRIGKRHSIYCVLNISRYERFYTCLFLFMVLLCCSFDSTLELPHALHLLMMDSCKHITLIR